MDHSKQDMINLLSQHMIKVLKYLVQTTNDSFQILANQMAQIGDVLVIPWVVIQNETPI